MALIEIKDLSKSYGSGDKRVDVLKGISLTVEKGETIAVLGASGVGKSTFLNILGALDRPTGGEVLYNGEAIFNYDNRRLARFRNASIGFVFQFHHLLPEFTALENVMMPALISGGDRDAARSKAEELLVAVGLSARMHHKPGELSGGEAQRTAIVRALVQSPEVVLADEPTGNLDTHTGEEVFEVLLRLNRSVETTMIIVTHNERLAGRMTRQLTMVDGAIREEAARAV